VLNGKTQNLLIDADDTLWENNIYFERVIKSVQDLLLPFGVDPKAFRLYLDQREKEHISTHGYGTVNFTRSLVRTFEHFAPEKVDPSLASSVEGMALGIMNHPIEILDGVPETLEYLSGRHDLFLVTKGDTQEQGRKIETSGLSGYFRDVKILPEKNTSAYRSLVDGYLWDPDRTWMIGNSPRSDVNPAIAAGLNAVYIPHPHTWVLEHEEPLNHPRVIELEKFSDLRKHF
jgi:putative hydrolase of the HAD superfamily